MEIKIVPMEKLIPADYNPRKDLKPGDIEYSNLKQSIQQFGFVEPIVWNKRTGNVVGGHQRLKVLKELGVKDVETVVVDIDPKQEMTLNLSLNKIESQWDLEMLADVLTDLKADGLMQLTGFDDQQLNSITMDDDQFRQMFEHQQHQEQQHQQSDTFTVTFVLPYQYTELVDMYFENVPNAKQILTDAIIVKAEGIQ